MDDSISRLFQDMTAHPSSSTNGGGGGSRGRSAVEYLLKRQVAAPPKAYFSDKVKGSVEQGFQCIKEMYTKAFHG